MNEFMKNFSLEGKIAFVTGASYGIGFAIANALSAARATIPPQSAAKRENATRQAQRRETMRFIGVLLS